MMLHRRLLVGLAALLAAAGAGQAATAKPLVHAIPADIASLDPANFRTQQDQEIVANVYERLARMKFIEQKDGTLLADPVEVVPELAESWTIDGPVITFKLRPGVKFYATGNPMTAEDVRYSFERLISIPSDGKTQANTAGIFKSEQIEVVDPMTVKITFTDGNGTPTAIPVALTSMKFRQFAIIDSVEVKKHATADDPWAIEWLTKNLAATGPYYIANRTLGQQVELKAVPNHWSGKQPAFEEVILRVIGNADLVSLIKGGVVDYAAEGLTGRQYDALQAAGFSVLHGETPSIMRLHMAMDKEPFTDKRVRQAMLHAIPHDRIIKTALAGRGKRQVCLWNAEDWTCDNSYEKYKYDSNQAKALLKEAGKEKFSFDFWYSTALPYNSDMAIIIAEAMKSIGVTVNLKPTPALQLLDAYRARINGVDQNMSGMYLNEFVIWLNDPATLTNLGMVTKTAQGGVANWARFSDSEVDEAHLKYRNSSDKDGRLKAYRMIQDKAADAAATMNPIILVGRTIVVNPKIAGVTFSQDPFARYAYLHPK
jgi:peptide/nickel transport system substrate-binding protein